MNTKKMAIVGTGLMIAGMGLSAVGAALVVPAILELTSGAIRRASGLLISQVERGSIMMGTAAGALQRSLKDAQGPGSKEV